MLVASTADHDGNPITIVGLDHDCLDRLRDRKPMASDLPGLPHVVILGGETLRDVVATLVEIGWLPPSALDEYRDPETDTVTRWDPAQGTTVAGVDELRAEAATADAYPAEPGIDPTTDVLVRLLGAAMHTVDTDGNGIASLGDVCDDAARVLAERGVS